MKDCVFCNIVSGELPTEKILEEASWAAFRDIRPKAPVHVLVVPKEHIESLGKTGDGQKDLLGTLLLATRTVAEKLGIHEAYQVRIFSGENAGQSVFHLHLHVLGGWKEKQNDD